jgi:protein phosphatase
MTLTIPELSLVVLIGPSGCGKSTLARKHFKATEVLSSDGFRGLVCDDENDQAATNDAFAALHYVAARRLARGRLTVIDATNVQPEARKPLVALAREYHVLPVAVVLDLPERVCHDRNRSRPNRDFGPHVVRNQKSQLHRSMRGLGREGFRHVHVLKTQDEVDAAVFERQPLWNNRKSEHLHSTSSATCTAVATNSRHCSTSSDTPRTATPAGRILAAARPFSLETWSIAGRELWTRSRP